MDKLDSSTPTRIEVFFTYAAYTLSAIILFTLFVENFMLSSGFDILGFREIDDFAFQTVLRRLHLAISSGHFYHLSVINDYAYGWVFWFPLALVTYPLYLISTHFMIDWPLIAAPRQISLLFGIATLFIMRKIFKNYGMPEWIVAAGFLIFLLFPSFGYASLRFGTVNEVMFFSALSLYLAVANTPSTVEGRRRTAIALAFAGGVKLSGLLISPLIATFTAFRYQFKSLPTLARDLILATAVFIVLLIILSNAYLFIYPFHAKQGQAYFALLSYFIGATKTSMGPIDPSQKFYTIFFPTTASIIWMSILFSGLILYAIKSKIHRRDMLVSIALLVLIAEYLFHSVKNGSAPLYFTSISFLLLFGLFFFSNMRGGIIIVMVIISIQLFDSAHRAYLQYKSTIVSSYPWNHLSYYVEKVRSVPSMDESKKITGCIGAKDSKWSGHLFIDYSLPTGFNPITYPNACISIAWNNLSANHKYCSGQIDYIILDKFAPGALPQDQFDTMLKTADPKTASDLLTDRQSRQNIVDGNYFDERRFVKICDFDKAAVYAAEDVIHHPVK